MASRKVVHVVPDGSGGWNVKSQGAQRGAGNFENKAEAVARGKEIAKNAQFGQIKIHGQDGKIQTEHTYGNDPEKYPG